MRKLLSSLFLCLLLPTLAISQDQVPFNDDTNSNVIIVRDSSPSSKPRLPEKDPLSFTCYVLESANSLVLSSNKNVDACVCIENLSSGDYVEYPTNISGVPITLSIMGPGNYCLTISLSENVTYSGNFDL